ncbi:MAG TPA: nucleotidyltransferase family protein [Acidimicrobiales bacterium]|nr:nucleotidyltransferase family protein [Acidimicrobiales bacterium]
MTDRPQSPEVLRATAELLWQACHVHPEPAAVRAAISRGADVGFAGPFAVQQRIGPLLWRALEVAGELDQLGGARQSLREIVDVRLMEAVLLLPRAVSMALGPLVEAGLEPVVLKGPAVAARYPAPGLRPMEDIDLLLPRAQHARALELLGAGGWQVLRPSRRDRYDTVLGHREVPTLTLELHYGVEASYERATSLDADALWERRVPIDCLGTPAFGLPLAEELVYLSVHAGKPYHGFGRLVWIADVAMVVGHCHESGSDVDWQRVRQVAKKRRCTTVVAAALGLAEHAGVEVPPGMFALTERGWRAAALGRLLDPVWPLRAEELPKFHLRYALIDGWWRRARLLAGSGHGMPPTRRVRWSVGAPGDALARWWELHRRHDRGLDAA